MSTTRHLPIIPIFRSNYARLLSDLHLFPKWKTTGFVHKKSLRRKTIVDNDIELHYKEVTTIIHTIFDDYLCFGGYWIANVSYVPEIT